MDFKRKHLYRRFMYSPFITGMLILLLIFVSKAVWNVYDKYKLATVALIESNAEYGALTARNQFLTSEILKLETPSGQESILRERYSVAKEGEKMIIIVDDKNSSGTIKKETGGLWQKFLNLFK